MICDQYLQLKSKSIFSDRLFDKSIKFKDLKSNESENQKYHDMLNSDNIDLQCCAINFYQENHILINENIITKLIELWQSECFDLMDCINDFAEDVSRDKKILLDNNISPSIVHLLLKMTKSHENQFIVTALDSLSRFSNMNHNVAQFLFSTNFFQVCFHMYQQYVCTLTKLSNDLTVEINDILYIIEAFLKLFSSVFIHSDLVSNEYSVLVVQAFLLLLQVTEPSTHVLKLRVLIFDNIYWFAQSAPIEALRLIFDDNFLGIMFDLLELKEAIKISIFRDLVILTQRDDSFSIILVSKGIFNCIKSPNNWGNECIYSYCKLLRNISACNDLSPIFAMISSEASPRIQSFLINAINNSSYKSQVEAFTVLFYMTLTNNNEIIAYVISNFSPYYPLISTFMDSTNNNFITLSLASIHIILHFLNSKSEDYKNQFVSILKTSDWPTSLNELCNSSDEQISKLSISLLNEIF